jgi:hypothetical protein
MLKYKSLDLFYEKMTVLRPECYAKLIKVQDTFAKDVFRFRSFCVGLASKFAKRPTMTVNMFFLKTV